MTRKPFFTIIFVHNDASYLLRFTLIFLPPLTPALVDCTNGAGTETVKFNIAVNSLQSVPGQSFWILLDLTRTCSIGTSPGHVSSESGIVLDDGNAPNWRFHVPSLTQPAILSARGNLRVEQQIGNELDASAALRNGKDGIARSCRRQRFGIC